MVSHPLNRASGRREGNPHNLPVLVRRGRCAPLLGFDGDRSKLRSRLRGAASLVIDRRRPVGIFAMNWRSGGSALRGRLDGDLPGSRMIGMASLRTA
jgi:hypothetical protein